MRIDSVDEWIPVASRLADDGYNVFQMQFAATLPDGFHAWFIAEDMITVEVVTFSPEVQAAIVAFNRVWAR
jgi:hypothetical protein